MSDSIDAAGHGELKRRFVALARYRTSGYVERETFVEYRPDPFSVFMEKRL